MSVVLLCLVCAAMLYIFFCYHLLLISRGHTTNESTKQSHYKHSMTKLAEFLQAYIDTFGEDGKQLYRPTKENLDFFLLTGQESKKELYLKLEQCKHDISRLESGCYKPASVW